jgi:DNA-binding PadR family transcriptional regulator
MSLPHALLGLLNYRPTTGYQLKKAFKESIYFFWNATLPQIYRTLNQMEKKGWLTAVIEHQDGKPSRKVYKLTNKGLKEFRRWLKEPSEVPQRKNPMMLKIFFGNQMDKDQLVSHIQKMIEYHSNLLKKYKKEVKPVIQHYASITGASDDARYWAFTLEFGRMHAEMVTKWCDKLLKTINSEKASGPTKKRES